MRKNCQEDWEAHILWKLFHIHLTRQRVGEDKISEKHSKHRPLLCLHILWILVWDFQCPSSKGNKISQNHSKTFFQLQLFNPGCQSYTCQSPSNTHCMILTPISEMGEWTHFNIFVQSQDSVFHVTPEWDPHRTASSCSSTIYSLLNSRTWCSPPSLFQISVILERAPLKPKRSWT